MHSAGQGIPALPHHGGLISSFAIHHNHARKSAPMCSSGCQDEPNILLEGSLRNLGVWMGVWWYSALHTVNDVICQMGVTYNGRYRIKARVGKSTSTT